MLITRNASAHLITFTTRSEVLEQRYSELVRLEQATTFGATTCRACQGALPRELAFTVVDR